MSQLQFGDDESIIPPLQALLHARATTVAPSPEVIRGRVETARLSVAHQRPLGLWLSSMAALLVVVLVGAILLTVRPSAPVTGPGATPTPTRGEVTATPGPTLGARFPDGIPSAIDGLPVLRLAAAMTHIAAATDGTPFLIGGWERPAAPLACFATDLSTFSLSVCGRPSLADQASDLPIATPPLLLTELPKSVQLQPYGPLVLRVHVHDPAAAECDASVRRQCEVAVVVEAVMWSQDVPTSIGGVPVVSVYDILDRGAAASGAAATTDGGSLLVGGWLQRQSDNCFPIAISPLIACGNPALAASPEADASALPLAFLDTSVDLPTMGRVVLRGHLDDPSAAACPEAERTSCRRVFVVDAVVWQGLPDGWI